MSKIFKILFMTIILLFGNFIFANENFLIKNIIVNGVTDKDSNVSINQITSKYKNTKLSFYDMQKIQKKVESFYKKNGDMFVKVIIPKQDISDHILKLNVIRGRVENISIEGNKYYSSEFISNRFGLQSGEILEYKKMIKSLLLLNEYSDLQVKSFLKKGSKFATTDIALQVEDKKPFHMDASIDNLGSVDTSRYRLSANLFYGNLLKEGDEINLNTTVGTSLANTKLFRSDYAINLGKYKTKLNFGFLYANYVAAGDFSVLDMQGNTYIYTIGINQPLFRSVKDKVDLSIKYDKKEFKNFLLGSLSSKDYINSISTDLFWERTRIFDTISLKFSLSKAFSGDGDFGSRLNENINFIKYNLTTNYKRYINDKNSIQLNANAQYSADKLPVSEMFSLGGPSSVRGFEPSLKLGDSGFSSSVEWNYQPKINQKWLKNGLQVGLFLDYGQTYINNPVPGEENARLAGAGFNVRLNIKKKYFANFTVGFPIYNSVSVNDNKEHIYLVVGAKFF